MSRLPTVLDHETLPPRLVALVVRLRAHVHYLEEQIRQVEQDLTASLREDDKSRRLLEIPGLKGAHHGQRSGGRTRRRAAVRQCAAVRRVDRVGPTPTQHGRQAHLARHQ